MTTSRSLYEVLGEPPATVLASTGDGSTVHTAKVETIDNDHALSALLMDSTVHSYTVETVDRDHVGSLLLVPQALIRD